MPAHGSHQAPGFQAALAALHARGAVQLPGRPSDLTSRWLRRRRIALAVMAGVAVLGVAALATGIALAHVGAWALVAVLGAALLFVGGVSAGLLLFATRLLRDRVRSERLPVVLGPDGVVLRGIGPIPWGDLAPPVSQRILVKNDIGGTGAFMPLTPVGRERANAHPTWWTQRVGPRPYLHVEVSHLLLPGIDGLTEADTMDLFRAAHAMHGSARG